MRNRIKRKIRHWMRDSRYRDQRKYIAVGAGTVGFGLVVSLSILMISSFNWILVGSAIFVVTVLFLIWTFINE